jgi:hypothetical protein
LLKCDDCKKFIKKEESFKVVVLNNAAFRVLCELCKEGSKVIKI